MYNINMDLRANDGKKVIIKEAGGHLELKINDWDLEGTIKFSYDTWNELIDSVRTQHNQRTYDEIEDENLRLKGMR
jgi:iron uptake system EfeUOB component EfeO/EfeM